MNSASSGTAFNGALINSATYLANPGNPVSTSPIGISYFNHKCYQRQIVLVSLSLKLFNARPVQGGIGGAGISSSTTGSAQIYGAGGSGNVQVEMSISVYSRY